MKLGYLSAAAGAVILAALTGCNDGDSKVNMDTTPVTLKVIHMNDHHSHLESEEMGLTIDGVDVDAQVGGFARATTKIAQLQADNEHTLTLHAGDAFQGTVYYALFKSEADAAMMNMIDWDAFELGNHEFDDGNEELKSFLDTLNDSISILGANVVPSDDSILKGMWEPYVIKEMGGAKIGIIGIEIAQKTAESSNPGEDITFLDEAETVQKYVDELKNKHGVNKVILLSHYGYSNDKALVEAVAGVDLVIDGDSHTLMGDFSMVGINSAYAYPEMTTDPEGNPVCIAQAWQYSHIVGDLDVAFDENGLITSCSGTPVMPLGDSFMIDDVEVNATFKTTIMETIAANDNLEIVEEDAAALATLAPYQAQVEDFANEIIGSAGELLAHNRIPNDGRDGYNLPLGSDIAPVVSKAFYDLSNRADACIQNAGGVRISIQPGDISVGLSYTLLPFSNTLFEIDMYGSEIKQVLEDALTNHFDNGGSSGSFPYAYGLRYDIDMQQPANARILNLEIKDRTTGTWSAIDDAAMYVIVTNNYIAGGKDGYTTFKTVQDERGQGIDTYLDYALSFVKYVEAKEAAGEQVVKLPSEDHCIKSYIAP